MSKPLQYSSGRIANVLRLCGFEIGKVTEPDDVVDGEIEIKGTNFSVQVNPSYFFLFEVERDEEGNVMAIEDFSKTTLNRVYAIEEHVKKALSSSQC